MTEIKANPDRLVPLLQAASEANCARIQRNGFKYKSLSCWSYNIAIGCAHACKFCYVPAAQQSGNSISGDPESTSNHINKALKQHGVLEPQSEWGDYVLLRPWNEAVFLDSLRIANGTAIEKLNADGNRAVIFCSSTDPFQTLMVPGLKEARDEHRAALIAKQNLLNQYREFLVRRALELILEKSSLNVRILTRSCPGDAEWEVLKALAKRGRVAFGVSLPTMDEGRLKVYEPKAPGVQARLNTLQKAKDRLIPRYVAVAPTYPEHGEEEFRRILTAIKQFKPITIFHEPINIRADNVQRIAAHASENNLSLDISAFGEWEYHAFRQLQGMQKIAKELGLSKKLHLWPDLALEKLAAYHRACESLLERTDGNLLRYESREHKKARLDAQETAFLERIRPWLWKSWRKTSAWPKSRVKTK